MSAVFPFRALRPAPSAAPHVASVPYDVVNTEEARALARGEPLSFLHVTRSEIDLPPETDPHAPIVYARAAANLATLRQDAPLLQDAEPSLYVYRLRMGAHTQTGVAGGFSIDEYDAGRIKKHERTRQDKEDDRTQHILAVRAQTGLVFLTYRASGTVDALVSRATARDPVHDFAAPDGVSHTIWRVTGEDATALVRAYAAVPALYIADGHHRAASASRARAALRDAGGDATEAAHVVAVAFPDTQVTILPYHRVVRDLGGLSPDALLAAIAGRVRVTPGVPTPVRRREVSMFLGGRWHALALPDPGPHAAGSTSQADSLDVAILEREVLAPFLKIGDIRTDARIDFVGGARGTAELERLVTGGRAAIAFSMFPVTVNDLMAIADAGGIMPPKSTWFEPKLRDGLLVHLV